LHTENIFLYIYEYIKYMLILICKKKLSLLTKTKILIQFLKNRLNLFPNISLCWQRTSNFKAYGIYYNIKWMRHKMHVVNIYIYIWEWEIAKENTRAGDEHKCIWQWLWYYFIIIIIIFIFFITRGVRDSLRAPQLILRPTEHPAS
jgi:hypothetical protein